MALESLGVRVLILGMGEFRRDLGTIRQDLTATENAIGRMGTQTLNVGQRLSVLGDGMIALGRSMTLGLTVPIGLLAVTLGSAGVSFESTFAGISKTVDGVAVGFDEIKDAAQSSLGLTVTNMDEARAAADKLGMEFGDLTPVGQALRDEFRQLALDIPIPTNELNRLGEVIGQLGVSAQDLPEVTRLVAELGVATDIAAEDAAFGLVKIFNIIEEEGADIVDFMKRAGSTIVALGNNSAATEGEILNFGLRLAAAGERAKFSEPQLFAWATTLADVGARAELGGTAVSRALNEMVFAVETGDESLKTWAKVTNQSVDQFVTAFEEDASTALLNFVGDLKTGIETGKVTKDMLNELGLGGVRALDVIGRLGEAQERFTKNLDTANQAWAEAIALEEEAAKRFNTISSKIQLLKNSFTELGITIFDLVKDDIGDFVEGIRDLITWFRDLDPRIQLFAVRLGLIVAALGPVIAGIGIIIKIAGALALAFASPLAPIFAVVAALGLVAAAVSALSGLNLGAILGMSQDQKEAPASTFNRKNEGVETTPFDPLMLDNLKNMKLIIEGIIELAKPLSTLISEIFSAFTKGFSEGFTPFIEEFGPKLNEIFDNLGAAGEKLKPLGEALDKLFGLFGLETDFEGLGTFLGTIAGMSFDKFLDFGIWATENLPTMVDNLTDMVNQLSLLATNMQLVAAINPVFTDSMSNTLGPLGAVSAILGTLVVQTTGLGTAFQTAGLLATVASGLIQMAFNQVGAVIAGIVFDVIGNILLFNASVTTAGGIVSGILSNIGNAFSTLRNKAAAALGGVINLLRELVAAAQAAYAAVTGSPELKIQHPFELFEDFLKNTDIPGMVSNVLLSPSSEGMASPQGILPAGGGSSTTIDKSLNIGDISGVPMQDEGSLAEVLLKTTRRIQAMGSV